MRRIRFSDLASNRWGDLARITVDTTVQPKNVTHPTDARLMFTAIEKLGEQAPAAGVPLRQSYVRVAKQTAVIAGRYAHAKQFGRANRELALLRTAHLMPGRQPIKDETSIVIC